MKKLFLLPFISLAFVGCSDDSDNIPVLTPNAQFSYTINSLNYKSVNFVNASKSIHTQSKYLWYFGDGDSSFLENPIHEYKLDGYYNVVLKVTNKELIDSYSKLVRISNSLPDSMLITPVVSFVYSQKGRDFTFQNTTSGPSNGIVYYWNFGESTEFLTSIESTGNTKYTFTKDGAFNVVLKAVYNKTVYCINRTVYVSADYQPASDTISPIPSFSYFYNSDGKISFVNTSSYVTADTKYQWLFRSGVTSTDENPAAVTFPNGTYTVVLKVSNGNYTFSSAREIEVPKADKPVALFVYSQNGLMAKFVNASSNVNDSTKYQWVFGDGEFSSEESPAHIYNNSFSGKNFNVILKVSNSNLTDVYSSEINIP